MSGCSQIPPAAWISPVSHLHISTITVFKSFVKSCTDGHRCFLFDVILANWKAFPKLRMVKNVMLTGVDMCHSVDQLNWSLTTVGVALSGATCFECTVPLFSILIGKLETGCSPGLQVCSCWCSISHAQVQQDQGWLRARKLVLNTVCFLGKMLKTHSWNLWI